VARVNPRRGLCLGRRVVCADVEHSVPTDYPLAQAADDPSCDVGHKPTPASMGSMALSRFTIFSTRIFGTLLGALV
jgi:hypothetical protein